MGMAQHTYKEALRQNPGNVACVHGLKRIRLMSSHKDAGNEAFKAGRYQDAVRHYTAAMEADTQLASPFMAQCACNR